VSAQPLAYRIVAAPFRVGWFVVVGAYVLTRVWLLLIAAYIGAVIALLVVILIVLVPISFVGWLIPTLFG
jgi:hypothetical protein